jgi:drug/metabolite transporter (DMT)-like permease
MPYENPTFLTQPHEPRVGVDGSLNSASGRGNASSASVNDTAACLTPNTEGVRSPVSLHEDDLHTAVTAPLLSRDALRDRDHPFLSQNSYHHNGSFENNQSYCCSNLHTHGPSPQQCSLSPSTNVSVCVAPHSPQQQQRWSLQPGRHPHHEGGGSAASSVSDLFSVQSRHGGTTTATAAAAAASADGLLHSPDNVSFDSEVGAQNSRDLHDAGRFAASLPPPSPQLSVAATYAVESQPRGIGARLLSIITPSIIAFRDRLHRMTWKRILWVVLLVALVMVGNLMQIVMLNFWLISFPADGTPGNYTAFAVPGIFFAILFVLLFGAYAAIRRPSLRFAKHLHGWGILLGVGLCDAFNSWMATYAASNTSEVLQALFTNLCPLYAVFLSKWILHDTRRYANIYIAAVFVLTIMGILAASLYGLITDRNVSEGKWWILIFFLSMPVRVLMNVWQSLYMIVYTRDPKFVSWLRVRFAEETPTMVDADGEQGHGKAAEAAHVDVGAAAVTEEDGLGAAKGIQEGSSHHPHRYTHRLHLLSFSKSDDDALRGEPLRGASAGDTEDDSSPHHSNAPLKNNPYVVAGEPDSDLPLPVITITTPTPTLHEQQQQSPPPQTRYDEATKSPHSQRVSPKDHPVDSHVAEEEEEYASAVPSPLAVEEPVETMSAEIFHDTGALQETTFGVGDEEEEEDVLTPIAAAAPPLPMQTLFTVRYNQGEDTVVKLVMLAGETFIQMCFTLSLLPADALPWWGNSDTVQETWANFREGLHCVFTIRENFLYCFLYTLGFVFTYVGCAYLNHYSAALCSIVSQLSSPVTALMLVIVPSWNVQQDGDSPWYCNVIAILLLCVAALLYVLWEEMTDHEKVQAEYALKMEQLHVRPSSHEKPHSVVIDG